MIEYNGDAISESEWFQDELNSVEINIDIEEGFAMCICCGGSNKKGAEKCSHCGVKFR